MSRTKRQRRMAVKSDLLDMLAMTVRETEWDSDRHGLTPDECAAVADDLGDQLYRWSVRITPLDVPAADTGTGVDR